MQKSKTKRPNRTLLLISDPINRPFSTSSSLYKTNIHQNILCKRSAFINPPLSWNFFCNVDFTRKKMNFLSLNTEQSQTENKALDSTNQKEKLINSRIDPKQLSYASKSPFKNTKTTDSIKSMRHLKTQ